jgi:anaerobic magnesium-protoporphyrin IX monomethyl ester cyclase
MTHSPKNLLLIDIPTYQVVLPELHRELIERRIRLQDSLLEKRVGVRVIRPGLTYSRGLLVLAACLETSGYQVKYLVHSDPFDRTRINDLARDADVVCITSMTPTFYIAKELFLRVKTINPQCVTVLGGPHVNGVFENALVDSPEIDYLVFGEGEKKLLLLLKNLDTPWEVNGLAYHDNGDIVTTAKTTDSIVVSELPPPAYHLLSRPLSDYAHNIKGVRGCPYKCSFCFERQSWTSFRTSSHDVEQVILELRLIREQIEPNTLIHFSDAIFNIDSDRTAELLERIRQEFFDIYFSCDTRVDLVREEEVAALRDANFIHLRMGYESVHNNILGISKKASTSTKQYESSEIIRNISKKIAIHAYMVTGLPGTTKESLALDAIEIQKMVETKLVDIVGNKILVPYPGTPYHDNPEEHGIKILTKEWNKYDRRSYPTFRLLDLSADEIYFGYLYQEAALASAYQELLGASVTDVKAYSESSDYVYTNYAMSHRSQ